MAKDFYHGSFVPTGRSYFDKENRCRQVFDSTVSQYGGIWHLCTPGDGQTVIFRKKEHYGQAMIIVATCAHDCPGVAIITFEIMSNHVHFIICGGKEETMSFFNMFKRRLARYFVSIGEKVELSGFECKNPIAIDNLESLRNQICYTNRNNFVVDPDQTPFSYPYGANSYFFLPWAKRVKDSCFGNLTERAKRVFLHSKQVDYPDSFIIVDGYISPVSYCRITIGESVFRDARHYYHKLSKNVESYQDIARHLGDTVFYTDDELNDAIFRICRERFNGQRVSSLDKNEKLNLAKSLHFDFNADNTKISRLLGLSKALVDELFPLRK